MDETAKSQKRDIFAEIAERRSVARDASLVAPSPAALPDRILTMNAPAGQPAFIPGRKMDTAEQLRGELARQRERYMPFLQNMAPELPRTRVVSSVGEFDWRLQDSEDLADALRPMSGGGLWETVSIPHYGPPLGRATAFYRTTFSVTADMLARGAVFACFKGVDYKAQVFVNGHFLGCHEGFFAPFEFDCTSVVREVDNVLLVIVENDAICGGNGSWGKDGNLYEGDKIYAATGPGYNEPTVGWHHCPPGMGIYQAVTIEARSPIHIGDLFVRTLSLDGGAEIWIELYNCRRTRQDVTVSLSVYGQNFRETVLEDMPVEQSKLGPGVNYLRVPVSIANPHVWDIETPWLYQLQAAVLDSDGKTLDTYSCQFGIRTFVMDEHRELKGKFLLNGREIRLRGANTMGFEQQDVMKGDFSRLIDDILLAKICNMNFWRITQRPVQSEVYDYCDRLGLMTQSDLPLFGCLRRNQFAEAVRQSEEMERLVRSHPCNIVVSYINEPFPAAADKPHRHLTRDEMERFFLAADQAVRIANPDRVIKAVDGDYDPPAPGYPDNHCYCGWYNGHGVDLGRLHKGYWQPVKPGWHYGCGEFGAEGLDPVETMRKYYPPAWLPQNEAEDTGWTPNSIPGAQTGRFHYFWFETQHSLADWVDEGQRHQALVTKLMTEAFRRDSRMNSCAIHLFIDAFPSGWMKTIMDVDRNPKPAYFAYRDALTPLMVSLRTDRFSCCSGEDISVEAWVCNDLADAPDFAELRYQMEMDGRVLLAGTSTADIATCGSLCQGTIPCPVPKVAQRAELTIRLALADADGRIVHDTDLVLDVFPTIGHETALRAFVIGAPDGTAARLADELAVSILFEGAIRDDVILIDDPERFKDHEKSVVDAVQRGACAVLLEWPVGSYQIGGTEVVISPCGMEPRHAVSRATGHPIVAGLRPHDVRFWYDPEEECIAPLLHTTFVADGWTPILASGNGDWAGSWGATLAAAEKRDGQGLWRICQVRLAGRTAHNPVAAIIAKRMLSY